MRRLICLSALALAGSPALAEPSIATPPAPAVAQPQAAAPLSLEDLAAVNGREGAHTEVTLLSDQDLSATSSGNSITANTVRSGDVSFGAGALSAFSGVGNFVVNTGNNNNLQGAISVNIITAPIP
jgi:hypothetical protein